VPSPAPDWLAAGAVGRPHGLDGSFYVTQARAELLAEGVHVRLGDAERAIVRRAGTDERPILRLEGCADRHAAESLRGEVLRVARGAAPELEEGEWWAEDLEGCRVRDGGREVGVVERLLALPSCEVLEVRRTAGAGTRPLLVPLVGDAVRSVDVAARDIDVDLRFLAEEQ